MNLKATNQPRRAIRYFANSEKVAGFADCLQVGTMFNATPKEIEDSLLSGHHDRHVKNRICRTAIISVKTPKNATKEQIEDLVKRVSNAFQDFFKELNVPGAAWIHGNTKTIHGHGIFPNSDGRRTLNICPADLRSLQGFEWTDELDSGRGKGERGALPVYTKAKNLAVRELAKYIFDTKGKVGEIEVEALESAGVISNIRRKKDGQPISFAFKKKQIRFSTLKNFITEQKQQNNSNMITAFDSKTSAPPPLMDALKKLGFGESLLTETFNRIKETNQQAKEREQANKITKKAISKNKNEVEL